MSLFSKIFKYVWPQVKKNQGLFYALVVLYFFRIIVDFTILPLFFKKIVDIFSNVQKLPIDQIRDQAFSVFYVIVGLHISIFFIARAVRFGYYNFAAKTRKELRDFTFQKIQKQSYAFFANTYSGSLVTKSRRFVFGFDSAIDVFFFNFLKVFAVMSGALTVLLFQMPEVALFFAVWAISNVVLMLLVLRIKIKYDLLEAEQDSKISGRLSDVFGNILAVKFFSAEKREKDKFGEYTEEGKKRDLKASYVGGFMDMIQNFLIIFMDISIVYIMIHMMLIGEITVGQFVLIEGYVIMIGNVLWDLSAAMVRFTKAVTDMKETVDMFELVPDISDPKKPEKLKITDGLIVFDSVDFGYPKSEKILENFNLEIKPGERIGLVGHSGAGKSTITKLILRFTDVSEGSIKIDGQDIRKITQNDLRSVISYVPQESILFHRSIGENIGYGKFDATKEEISEAAKKAHAHEFISKLPNGYDTLVGERGVKLSGGERQRVAIARAMLKDAPILVLDEATSSLDSISEHYIQDAFNELMKGKTTIVIAHRLSTIQKMDRIIVLDAGKIVEEGTHTELLNKNGFYANLWNHQTGVFLE